MRTPTRVLSSHGSNNASSRILWLSCSRTLMVQVSLSLRGLFDYRFPFVSEGFGWACAKDFHDDLFRFRGSSSSVRFPRFSNVSASENRAADTWRWRKRASSPCRSDIHVTSHIARYLITIGKAPRPRVTCLEFKVRFVLPTPLPSSLSTRLHPNRVYAGPLLKPFQLP